MVDGIITDPRKCSYDPAALICKAGDDPARCLTASEVDAIRKIWDGPRSATGERLWFGLERSTPLDLLAGADVFPIGNTYLQYWVHQDPMFDWRTLAESDLEGVFRESQRKFNSVIGTDNPDLEGFRKRGGKMIIWHGESDTGIFPRGTINYFERVLAAGGGRQQVDQFARLFMAPGVGHCAGGDGPESFGLFDTLVNWVENGVAPDTVPAMRQRPDGTVMSRPLCRYPMVAKWNGTGSTDDAANFSCVDSQQRSSDFSVANSSQK